MQVCYNTGDVFGKQAKCCNCGFLALTVPPSLIPASLGTTIQDLKAAKEVFFSTHECTGVGRKEIAQGSHSHPDILICVRNVWSSLDFEGKQKDAKLQLLSSNRKCPYFFPYNPGYSPIEHRELQRDAKNQRLLMIGMLLAALIGAAAAIITQVVAR